jgi:hypothetical protein
MPFSPILQNEVVNKFTEREFTSKELNKLQELHENMRTGRVKRAVKSGTRCPIVQLRDGGCSNSRCSSAWRSKDKDVAGSVKILDRDSGFNAVRRADDAYEEGCDCHDIGRRAIQSGIWGDMIGTW